MSKNLVTNDVYITGMRQSVNDAGLRNVVSIRDKGLDAYYMYEVSWMGQEIGVVTYADPDGWYWVYPCELDMSASFKTVREALAGLLARYIRDEIG
jgi:hypothetical protein